jgi:hypothetical protein
VLYRFNKPKDVSSILIYTQLFSIMRISIMTNTSVTAMMQCFPICSCVIPHETVKRISGPRRTKSDFENKAT